MEMSYQERLFFLDRYKTVVYSLVSEHLIKYVKDTFDMDSKEYREVMDELSIPMIKKMCDNRFYYIVERYAERDCDCMYTHDCAADLERRLIEYWNLR